MFARQLKTGILVFAALVCDLALPVWLNRAPILPSSLDFAFLMVCLRLHGGELVFWAGCLGLLQDDLTGQPIGSGIAINATIALIAPRLLGDLRTTRALIDRLLSAVGILLMLGAAQFGARCLQQPQTEWTELATVLGERLAATFLAFLVCQMVAATMRALSVRNLPFHEYKA